MGKLMASTFKRMPKSRGHCQNSPERGIPVTNKTDDIINDSAINSTDLILTVRHPTVFLCPHI